MKCYLNVVNMTQEFFSGYIQKIYITGLEGDLDIYPGHTPLITMIQPSPLYIFLKGAKKKIFYISGGILEVQPSNINILSEIVIPNYNLKKNVLLEKEKSIKKKILNAKKSDLNKLKKKLFKISVKLKVTKI